MIVRVLPRSALEPGQAYYDVTTHGSQFRPLSPMLLGPVPLYAGMQSRTMENAWQYAKVFPGYDTAEAYWPWARAGWDNPRGVRYPAGRGARPYWHLWAGDKLAYVTARKRLYAPLYAQAVRMHQMALFLELRRLVCTGGGPVIPVITDFDAYDHQALGYSWDDVLNDPDRKTGHGFVLAMMIEGYL